MSGLRWGGAALIAGAVLIVGRMAPVMAAKPADMPFPPPAPEDLARLAELAGPAWPFAHAVGLIALALLTFGYWAQAGALRAAGHRVIGTLAAGVATLAFGVFAIAMVIDGFLVPADLARSVEAGAARHAQALMLFGPAITGMFLAIGLLSSRMLHGLLHSRWLGIVGMGLAVLALTAWLFGITGFSWNANFQISGSLMMLGYAWHLALGAVSLFGRGVRS